MAIFRDSERHLDRVLERRAGGAAPADDRLTAFVRELPRALAERPDEATEVRHLTAITQAAARVAAAPAPAAHAARRSPRRRGAMALARLAGATAGTALVMSSLAFAGVTLPGPARDVAEAVGLPNQSESPAADVQDVIRSTPPAERGCEFGRRVSEAASRGRRTARSAEGPCKDRSVRGERGRARTEQSRRDAARTRDAGAPARFRTLPAERPAGARPQERRAAPRAAPEAVTPRRGTTAPRPTPPSSPTSPRSAPSPVPGVPELPAAPAPAPGAGQQGVPAPGAGR